MGAAAGLSVVEFGRRHRDDPAFLALIGRLQFASPEAAATPLE